MPSWKKRGVLFSLPPASYRSTHCQVPSVMVKENSIRIYYAGRNSKGMSYPAFLDIDRVEFAKDRIKITELKDRQGDVMDFGTPGSFDSDGIMPSCIIQQGDELWMYYTGWNEKSKTARYHNAIGLAVSKDGGDTFKQKFPGPVIDRLANHPGLAVTPFVIQDNWFRMWYISGVNWNRVEQGDGTFKYEPVYVIRYAESLNGVNWNRPDPSIVGPCIEPSGAFEAFSNPAVIKTGTQYHMWYCYRGSEDYRDGKNSYRIGYGISDDGEKFTRLDHYSGIELGKHGEWDSLMQCYPYVIKIDGRLLMFYNGNGFGQTGIGYAVFED